MDTDAAESVLESESEEADTVAVEPELLETFLYNVSEVFNEAERREHIRLTNEGIFISEDFLPTFLERYVEWVRSSDGDGISADKLKRRLFDGNEPDLLYLVEGKSCLVGFEASHSFINANKIKLEKHVGSLASAKTHLNPRDPILQNLEDVESVLSKTGFELRFQSGGHRTVICLPELHLFAELASHSKDLQKRHPELAHSLRKSIRTLGKILSDAKAVKPKRGLLIPGKYRSNKEVIYLQYRQLTFVKERSGKILFVYELKGQNLRSFLNKEMVQVVTESRKKQLGCFELKMRKGGIFGNVKTKLDRFSVGVNALKDFYIAVVRAKALPKFRLKGFYTVHDCAKALSPICSNSSRIELRDLPRFHGEGQSKKTRYRLGKGWVLYMNERNEVFGLAPKDGKTLRAEKKPRPAKDPSQAQGSTDADAPRANDTIR